MRVGRRGMVPRPPLALSARRARQQAPALLAQHEGQLPCYTGDGGDPTPLVTTPPRSSCRVGEARPRRRSLGRRSSPRLSRRTRRTVVRAASQSTTRSSLVEGLGRAASYQSGLSFCGPVAVHDHPPVRDPYRVARRPKGFGCCSPVRVFLIPITSTATVRPNREFVKRPWAASTHRVSPRSRPEAPSLP